MADPLPDPAPRLPDDVLARRAALPKKPAAVVLAGARVELRPLDLDADIDALHAVSCGAPFRLGGRAVGAYDPEALIWRYMSDGPFATAAELRAYLAPQVAGDDRLPFTVRDVATGTPIGTASLMSNHPEHLKIELGAIWYGPIAHGTGASRDATQLLLAHVFALGYRRAEWKCDARNTASRRAAVSYGFTFEGIHAQHMIAHGRSRDTAWYRMLREDFAR
jgi:RimJ/RimL family protein N-acetyltransferase